MSRKQAVLSGAALLRILRRAGFCVERIRGSHHFLSHVDGRKTVVPVHGQTELKPGTLRGILRDVGIAPENLNELI